MADKKILLAIVGGSKFGNTEILAKEALMAAAELGVEVRLMRSVDLDLKQCTACRPCVQIMKGKCKWNDDGAWVEDQIKDCDGLLVASSIYSLTPPGFLLTIRDRCMGPRLDVDCTLEAANSPKGSQGGMFDDVPFLRDPRLYKKRVGGIISIGGALDKDWTSLSLPNLHTLIFPAGIKLVDFCSNWGCADQASVTLRPEVLADARRVGRHIAEAMLDPENAAWAGPDAGLCPHCHGNCFVLDPDSSVAECAVCGVRGEMSITDGKVRVNFTEVGLEYSRYLPAGRAKHGREVFMIADAFNKRKDEAMENLKKYKAYSDCVLTPPSKEKQ